MMWITPLAGMILGSIGGGGGMLLLIAVPARFRIVAFKLPKQMRSAVTPLPLHDPL